MTRGIAIIPALIFIVASIMFGGAASAGLYANAALQLAAALGIAFAIVTPERHPGGTQRGLLLVLTAVLALSVVQVIPLPPAIWSNLPGRFLLVDTLRMADLPLGWRPISVMPDATIGAGLALLPAIAAALIGMRASRDALVAIFATLTIVMIGSVVVALMQKTGGLESPLYFYAVTNRDAGVGFFANSNHLGTLCAASIPIATGVFVSQRGSTRINTKWLILAGIILLALLGTWAAGSGAGVGLTLVALISMYAIARMHRGSKRVRYAVVAIMAALLLGTAIVVIMQGMNEATGTGGMLTSGMDRPVLWRRTIRAIMATMPFGSGLGSFTAFYPQFENPMTVIDVFANHAHNDYLETLMTGGIPALALMIAFAIWWVRTSILIWRSSTRDAFSEAATIVTAIVMLHEAVDYPIRTAAIAVIFGLSCGIMARPRRIVEQTEPTAQRAGRHVAA